MESNEIASVSPEENRSPENQPEKNDGKGNNLVDTSVQDLLKAAEESERSGKISTEQTQTPTAESKASDQKVSKRRPGRGKY